MNTFSPVVRPKVTTPNKKVRSSINSFGDGYEQELRLGINAVYIESLSLSWEAVTAAQSQSLDDFFTANAGKTFLWTIPYNSTTKMFKCDEWSAPFDSGIGSFSATLREVFA